MKFWAINQWLKDLAMEHDACGGTNLSTETEIA